MMTRQIASIYLWIAPLLSILVGGLRNLAGTEALIAGYAVFVALTAAAIWKLGAAKEGRVREHSHFGKRVEDDSVRFHALNLVDERLGRAVKLNL